MHSQRCRVSTFLVAVASSSAVAAFLAPRALPMQSASITLGETTIICHPRPSFTSPWSLNQMVDDDFDAFDVDDDDFDDFDAIDVDYENVYEKKTKKKKKIKSLIDVALEQIPDASPVRFIDQKRQAYIDCKVAFMPDIDGVIYAIGIPFHNPVGICFEYNDGTVDFFDPDNDENEEMINIIASEALQEIGEEFKLKRTPRVLTMEGDLDSLTSRWKESIKAGAEPLSPEALLAMAEENDEEDDVLKMFDDFMKKDIGDNYKEILNDVDTGELDMDEIMELFDVPGQGTMADDKESEKELLDLTAEDMEKVMGKIDLDDETEALRLLTYDYKQDKRGISLVQLLNPPVLVARQDDTGFVLLDREEESVVVPILEKRFEAALQQSGLMEPEGVFQ